MAIDRRAYIEVRALKEMTVLRWPAPDGPIPLVYLDPHMVLATYDLPFTRRTKGIITPQTATLELFILRFQDEWTFFMFRLHAKGVGYAGA